MSVPLSPRDRRAVALGAVAVGVMLAWVGLGKPLLGALTRLSDQLRSERAMLERSRTLLATAEAFPDISLEAAARLEGAAARLFRASSVGAASAAHGHYLQEHAEKHRVLVTRLEPLASRELDAGVTSLPLSVRGESDLQGLMTFLHAVETGGSLIVVNELRIDARSGARTSFQVLAFTLKVTGFGVLSDTVVVDGEKRGRPPQ